MTQMLNTNLKSSQLSYNDHCYLARHCVQGWPLCTSFNIQLQCISYIWRMVMVLMNFSHAFSKPLDDKLWIEFAWLCKALLQGPYKQYTVHDVVQLHAVIVFLVIRLENGRCNSTPTASSSCHLLKKKQIKGVSHSTKVRCAWIHKGKSNTMQIHYWYLYMDVHP